jgi:glycosyltransferase involved in cell wall biosynthesis
MMSQLKIMQVAVRFHPFIGGVEKYIEELSKALVGRGHKVTVVCADEPHCDDDDFFGVKVIRLPYVAKVANTNITPRLFLTLMKSDFDVIHTHIPTPWSADIAALVSLLKRKPLCVTYHNDIVGQGLNDIIARAYNALLLPLVLGRAKKIIVTQPKYVDTSAYLKRYQKKVAVIPLGVSQSHAAIDDVKRDPDVIFFMSVLDKYHDYKGLDVLLRAMSEVTSSHPRARLLVGGGGDSIDKYRALASGLGISDTVEFLGRLSDQDLWSSYKRSGIFVLPSLNRLEGFGIVALEALACGTPVITTPVAGSSEFIQRHGAGLVVPPNEVSALAAGIKRLLDNPDEASRMGERGSSAVLAEFDWDTIAGQVLNSY